MKWHAANFLRHTLRYILILLALFYFLFAAFATSYALPFGIVPKAGTTFPTTVLSNAPATAYYTVTNNTLEQRNSNFVKYLPPNVAQVTTGGTYSDTCGPTFNLTPNGQAGDSCTLQLSITGPVNASDPDPHHHLFVCFPGGITCAGTNNPLNVSVFGSVVSIAITPTASTINTGATQQFTAIATLSTGGMQNVTSLVTWNSSNTAVATISSSGLATGVSVGTSNITASLGAITSNTAVITVNSFLYVTNGPNIQYCAIAISSGAPTPCITIADPNTQITPSHIALQHPPGTFAYVTNGGGNKVFVCTIDVTLGLTGCTQTGDITFTGGTGSVAVNPTNTFAYIATGGSGIIRCAININGTLSSCVPTTVVSLFVTGISINSAGTIAYYSDQVANSVFACPILSNGLLGVCTNTSGGFTAPFGNTINTSNTVFYVAQGGGTQLVRFCAINAMTGGLSGCTNSTNPTGSNVFDIATNFANTFAYVTTGGANVFYCTFGAGGNLNSCTPQPGFTNSSFLAITRN